MPTIERVVIWFSAGVTSAIAGSIATERYKGVYPIHWVNTDTGSEDPDNFRFMKEWCDFVGVDLEIIRSEKYKDTFAVYDASGFMKGPKGAKCSVELKKKVRQKYENLATDLQVFGYDAGEGGRIEKFKEHNPLVMTYFPLFEHGIYKDECRRRILLTGIREPRTYAEGFINANCLLRGCVRGGMGYWNHVRKMRPDVFWNMARKERELNFALNTKQSISEDGERIKTPIFLDELDPNDGNYKSEPAIQCGLFCGQNGEWD